MAAIGPSAAARQPDAVLELRRVTERLAALSPQRLERAGPDGTAPAERVRAAVQELADRAANAEGAPRRDVPVLGLHALADQLQVVARDAIDAAGPAGRDDVAAVLATLRRAL